MPDDKPTPKVTKPKPRVRTHRLFDLDPFVSFDIDPFVSEGTVMHSKGRVTALLRNFVENDGNVEPAIRAYIVQSLARFLEDPKHDLEKAFGLKKQKAGNPGGLSKKRRTTPDEKIELAIKYEEYLKDEQKRRHVQGGEKSPRGRAIARLKKEFKVSAKTIETAITELKAPQKLRQSSALRRPN